MLGTFGPGEIGLSANPRQVWPVDRVHDLFGDQKHF